MSLEDDLILEAENMITELFGPQEIPSSNKPASFKIVSGGYRSRSEVAYNVENLIRVEYTSQELRNEKIQINDVRFIGLAKQFETVPEPDSTNFTWNGVNYTVVSCKDIFNVLYDIQARPL